MKQYKLTTVELGKGYPLYSEKAAERANISRILAKNSTPPRGYQCMSIFSVCNINKIMSRFIELYYRILKGSRKCAVFCLPTDATVPVNAQKSVNVMILLLSFVI